VLSAAECAAMAGRILLGSSRLPRRRREVVEVAAARYASFDAKFDVQICYMSYSNCKGQYLNKTLELFYYEMIITF